MLARMLMLQRERPERMSAAPGGIETAPAHDPAPAPRKKRGGSYNFLADRTVPRSESRDSL